MGSQSFELAHVDAGLNKSHSFADQTSVSYRRAMWHSHGTLSLALLVFASLADMHALQGI